MIVAATGHRLHILPTYRGDGSSQRLRTALLETAMGALEEWHPDLVISGMATGWDMAVAAAAMFLNVPFHAYVPFEGQDRLWGSADRTMYRSLLDEAADVRVISSHERRSAYYDRDMAMVDALTGPDDRMIALWLGDPTSGTALTLDYADGWLVPWSNYREAFMRRIENGPDPL